MLLMGIWMSLTKYPMKPMTANPIPTILQIWTYSVGACEATIEGGV